MRRLLRGLGALVILLAGCAEPPPPPIFVRDGLVLADGRVEQRPWKPGEVVEGAVAPRQPGCVPMFHVELEDRRREASLGVPPPGAALAFSPDGARLAVGSVEGRLLVVDGWTGKELARTSFPEAAIKRVAWSPDGATLYAAEQSPDAILYALDAATLTPRWKYRLADDLESSVLPPKDDVYGLYSLPAAYAVLVRPDGTLVVAGSHGWAEKDGPRRNRSRLYHLGADGTRLSAWPPDGALDGVMLDPALVGDRVFVGLARSADGPPPPDVPIGGVMLLTLPGLQPAWNRVFEPLPPHFTSVYMWEAVGLGTHAFIGLGDGRAFVLDGDGQLVHTLTPGVPVVSAGVPISTGVGFGTVEGGDAWFLTTGTNIPWGSADPSARPPMPHPAQNTVHALRFPDTTRWARQVDHAVSGVHLAPDRGALLVGASSRATDTRLDLYGGLLLDPATGETLTWCPTEAPVDFRAAWAPDSRRFAVAEAPFPHEGGVRGAYRVTVFR